MVWVTTETQVPVNPVLEIKANDVYTKNLRIKNGLKDAVIDEDGTISADIEVDVDISKYRIHAEYDLIHFCKKCDKRVELCTCSFMRNNFYVKINLYSIYLDSKCEEKKKRLRSLLHYIRSNIIHDGGTKNMKKELGDGVSSD